MVVLREFGWPVCRSRRLRQARRDRRNARAAGAEQL